MKYILLSTLIALSLKLILPGNPQTGTHKPVQDNYIPYNSEDELTIKLSMAYISKDSSQLNNFFAWWNTVAKPNADSFISQNDTMQAVFDVYSAFYKPHDLLKLGALQEGNKLNTGARYIVIQNEIYYRVMPEEKEKTIAKAGYDSIINFRPPVDIDSNRVLYLTEEYYLALNNFLGANPPGNVAGSLRNPTRPAAENEKRYNMLRHYIPLLHGQWGDYWPLETQPYVSAIDLNGTLTRARLYFKAGNHSGKAALEKRKGQWRVVNNE